MVKCKYATFYCQNQYSFSAIFDECTIYISIVLRCFVLSKIFRRTFIWTLAEIDSRFALSHSNENAVRCMLQFHYVQMRCYIDADMLDRFQCFDAAICALRPYVLNDDVCRLRNFKKNKICSRKHFAQM